MHAHISFKRKQLEVFTHQPSKRRAKKTHFKFQKRIYSRYQFLCLSLVSAATDTAAAAHTPIAAAVPVLPRNASVPPVKQSRAASAAPDAENKMAWAAVSRSETVSEPPPLYTDRKSASAPQTAEMALPATKYLRPDESSPGK
jgi:hypothetical protein